MGLIDLIAAPLMSVGIFGVLGAVFVAFLACDPDMGIMGKLVGFGLSVVTLLVALIFGTMAWNLMNR